MHSKLGNDGGARGRIPNRLELRIRLLDLGKLNPLIICQKKYFYSSLSNNVHHWQQLDLQEQVGVLEAALLDLNIIVF